MRPLTLPELPSPKAASPEAPPSGAEAPEAAPAANAPLVSVIVPFHNHARGLAGLLQSLAAQTIASEMEVILVDDASDEDCAATIAAFPSLSIRLLRLPERRYTKNARLAGAAGARGRTIAFADADDLFWGAETLGGCARLLLAEDADIVHFPAVRINADGRRLGDCPEVGPLAERLEGLDIFRRYLETPGHKATLWAKVYSPRLVREILEPARASGVRRYREDILLSTLLYFRARRYLGTGVPGYAHRWSDKDRLKAGGRALSSWHLLRETAPWLAANGCPADLAVLYAAKQRRVMRLNGRLFCAGLLEADYPCLSSAGVRRLLDHGDYASAMRLLRDLAPQRPKATFSGTILAFARRLSGALSRMLSRR